MKFLVFFMMIYSTNLFSLPTSSAETITQLNETTKSFVQSNEFSGGIIVFKSGQTMLEEYHGYSQKEHKIVNDKETVFRIGSITKEFTATLIYILAEKKTLNLNDSVSKYLPAPKEWEKIKIHHLLDHTSGIENQATYKNYKSVLFKDLSPDKILEWISKIKILKAPGVGFTYSNAGYNILACIIERVTQKSFPQNLKELIFDPLDMSSASVTFLPLKTKKYALGYNQRGERIQFDMSTYVGAGEITMTVRDFLKWSQAVSISGSLLVNPSSLFQKSAKSKDGYYGHGFMIEDKNGLTLVGHNGNTPGFVSSHFISIKNNIHVAIFSNDERFTQIGRRLDPLAYNLISIVSDNAKYSDIMNFLGL